MFIVFYTLFELSKRFHHDVAWKNLKFKANLEVVVFKLIKISNRVMNLD